MNTKSIKIKPVETHEFWVEGRNGGFSTVSRYKKFVSMADYNRLLKEYKKLKNLLNDLS